MAERIVFHIDVNSAFLSWTAAHRVHVLGEEYDLRKVPSVVARDKSSRHSIILAKSTSAKKFGIQTGEPLGVANFIRHIHRVARNMGLTLADEAAWQAAEPLWHWPEKISAAEYWKKAEEELA